MGADFSAKNLPWRGNIQYRHLAQNATFFYNLVSVFKDSAVRCQHKTGKQREGEKIVQIYWHTERRNAKIAGVSRLFRQGFIRVRAKY
jgi:hypothetical protein